MSHMRRFAIALALGALSAAPLAGQAAVLDEGSFSIARGGARVGREEFKISRTPGAGGDVTVAAATVTYPDERRRLSPALETNAAGTPTAYQIEVRSGPATQERLSGQFARGRFSARVQTPRGEAAKEYVVSDGALILDDDVFHQYYFVARAKRAVVPVVVPRRNVQVAMRVQVKGPETVVVGGRTVEATHLVLSEPGGADRDVWVDAESRVLKVAIPDRGVTATRDELPH
jgi:hypothetical protein